MDKHIKKNNKYSVKSIVLAGSSFCIPILILILIYILGGLRTSIKHGTGWNTTMNDAMFFQYNGLWSYSSCEKENTKRLAGKLGLNDMTWWITYHNEMHAASESLLGLKYIITSQPLAAGKDYTVLQKFQEEQVNVYKNPYALPLGFLVHEETSETNMDSWDVLAMENDLWKRMTGESEDIYLYAEREEIKCEEHLIEYRLVIENEFPIYTCK